jgi:UDP-glucose 4-epimerase
MDVPPHIIHLPPRKEVAHAFASHDKIRRFFDLPSPVPLKEGIVRMAEWVYTVGSRRTKEFTAIEIPFGLPDGW